VKSVVLVNGIPGAGKTTLSGPLAAELGFPLLAKDTIKESLFDSLGIRDRAWSRQLGAASATVMSALVRHMSGPVVLDINVSPENRHFFVDDCKSAGVELVVEVWCEIPTELAFERYQARVGTTRHPGHCDETLVAQGIDWWIPQNTPAALGPVLRVDTTGPIDVVKIADWVRAELS
jgi:predicted kinase